MSPWVPLGPHGSLRCPCWVPWRCRPLGTISRICCWFGTWFCLFLAIENHHVLWLNQGTQWAIFNNFLYVFHSVGVMSSSQLTNSVHHFSEGWRAQPPTRLYHLLDEWLGVTGSGSLDLLGWWARFWHVPTYKGRRWSDGDFFTKKWLGGVTKCQLNRMEKRGGLELGKTSR